MNRRSFLTRFLAPAAAGAIVAPLLPSEVFPFRKIFLPLARPFSYFFATGIPHNPRTAEMMLAQVEAIELEMFAKNIPDLMFRSSSVYNFFKKGDRINIGGVSSFRIPTRAIITSIDPENSVITASSIPNRLSLEEFSDRSVKIAESLAKMIPES